MSTGGVKGAVSLSGQQFYQYSVGDIICAGNKQGLSVVV